MATSAIALLHDPAVAALGWGLVHILWQGGCIVAIAAAFLRLLRGSDSRTRYAAAFGALLAVPAVFLATVARALASGPSTVSLPLPVALLVPVVPWMAAAWTVGLIVATLRLIGGWLRIRRIRVSAIPAGECWQKVVDAIAVRLGIHRAVRLMETSVAGVPGVVGWLSPVILFPAGLLVGFNPVHVQLIVAHELAHVRRHDYLLNLIQTVIETVFFYHPGVWWLSRRVRLEREHCCDDVVVAEFVDRRLYAEALAEIERMRLRVPLELALAAGGGDLLARIRRLMDEPAGKVAVVTPWVLSAATFAAMLAFASVGQSPAEMPVPRDIVSSVWLGAALGLGVGMRHALEPDHLVAVSTLVTGERNAFQSARLGLSWGVGHTITLLIAGSGLALVQASMPKPIGEGLELVVAIMLIALGVRALRSARALGTIGPETVHAHGSVLHRHQASADHVHIGPFALARRPLIVGMVHGIAGSGALAALVMTTMPTISVQVVFILLFGLGSTIGMAVLSAFAGLPLGRLAHRPAAFAWTSAVAGVISVIAGVVMIATVAAFAQENAGRIAGNVTDRTGGRLPGVTVVLSRAGSQPQNVVTDGVGHYEFGAVTPGQYDLAFSLINFAPQIRRGAQVASGQALSLDVVLNLTLSADVTVTGRTTFTNLADVADPAESLVGIAGAASEGAITAEQILSRPVMRAGEVLETVPGLIISQHSGEGKANQYYLRGFNLDHGTDFATSIAGVPVNMPTHAHGHGYTDANFLIPELVSGVQFKKGPYYAEEGDFSAAGAVNVNYLNFLERPIVEVGGGRDGWARFLAAASPRVGRGQLLAALELNHNDGPWTLADDYRKVNGVVRYSEGGVASGFSVTAMMYHGEWNATDQVPERAIAGNVISRFGHIDPTNGGETHRYSLSADAQWASGNTATRANAYFLNYALNLFSNFTYFLEDPDNGDQFEQEDRRHVFGGRVTHTRMSTWGNRPAENLFGAQARYDRIGSVGLYHTRARARLATTRVDRVGQSSLGIFAQNEYQWSAMVRTVVGLRGDVFNFDVAGDNPLNSGTRATGLISPKGSAIFGPWSGTELYVNAGIGFHSNDARGATTTRDPGTGEAVDPTTPVVRARGAEFGVRTVRIPKVQTTVAVWGLGIDSELLFIGDAGTTEATRPSRRVGIEWATFARPHPWVAVDADIAISRGRFTDGDPSGDRIPGSVESVISLGAAIDTAERLFGSVRVRHFGPRALIEDDSVRSGGTSLVNAQIGVRLPRRMSLVMDVFNLFDAKASDIDYFYRSRLPGEPPDGIDDIHSHPALPRSARVTLRLGF